jgi:lysophospholipase L1-like esterase
MPGPTGAGGQVSEPAEVAGGAAGASMPAVPSPDGGIDVGPRAPDAAAADAGVPDPGTLPAVTVYLAGDSTVMDYGAASAQEGWGQELVFLFSAKVTIRNEAIGGRSVQSFMYSDASNQVEASGWHGIKTSIKAGDYLMIQFGTNDSSGIAGRAVTPADFETLLGTMIDAVLAKHATPILVTPSALQEWKSGVEGNTRLGPYALAMQNVGKSKTVLVDDLNARGVELLNKVGQTAATLIYINGDKAHFTKYGATQMAGLVAGELRRIGSPLAAYLK